VEGTKALSLIHLRTTPMRKIFALALFAPALAGGVAAFTPSTRARCGSACKSAGGVALCVRTQGLVAILNA
jgi:hypothetical protein